MTMTKQVSPAANSGLGDFSLARLGDFATDARTLDPARFITRHGQAFLLHYGPLGALHVPRGPAQTIMAEDVPQGAASGPQADFLVFPIRKSDRSRFSQFVTLGRIRTNDIVVPDVSVSKVHAFFTANPDGAMMVQDAGSSTGTYVDGKTVAAHGTGSAVPLTTGTQLRCGGINFTYMDGLAFVGFVTQLLG